VCLCIVSSAGVLVCQRYLSFSVCVSMYCECVCGVSVSELQCLSCKQCWSVSLSKISLICCLCLYVLWVCVCVVSVSELQCLSCKQCLSFKWSCSSSSTLTCFSAGQSASSFVVTYLSLYVCLKADCYLLHQTAKQFHNIQIRVFRKRRRRRKFSLTKLF